MLDAKGLEAAARKLRNAEKEKFGSWPDADDSKSIAAATITAYLQAVGHEPVAVTDDLVNIALDAAEYCRNVETRKWMRRAIEAAFRSALVATPPAERVEETLTPDIYSQAWRDQMDKLITDDMVILALDAVDPDWNDEFSKAKARSNSRNWMRKVLRITIPIAAALATKPAVKDDEAVVEALPNWNGWRSIDTAPEDCRVILATAGGWVGEAIMLRDEDTGEQVWTWVDTGKPSLHSCYGWMPLPAPLVAPVLSDLRPDGFDGPTGAE